MEVRPYKRSRLYGALEQHTISVIVGEGAHRKSFNVHKDVLCAYSPFFEAACREPWIKDDDDQSIKLPEEEPEVIRTMFCWMYNNEICISEGSLDAASWLDICSTEGMSTTWGVLVKLFIAADKYQISRLMNHVLDALHRLWLVNFTPVDVVAFALENTLPESPLRRLLMRQLANDCDYEVLQHAKDRIPATIIFQLLCELQILRNHEGSDAYNHPCSMIFKLDEYSEEEFCKTFHDHKNEPGNPPCHEFKEYTFLEAGDP